MATGSPPERSSRFRRNHVTHLCARPRYARAGRRLAVPNQGTSTGEDWLAHVDREEARYRDGEPSARAADADARQRQLTRLGNASAGAGLALLMAGRRDRSCRQLHPRR